MTCCKVHVCCSIFASWCHHCMVSNFVPNLIQHGYTIPKRIIMSDFLLFHISGVYTGGRYMTANFHSLLHLPEVVRNLGPLWAHSCFPFEAANGELLTFFHGSQGIEKQVENHSYSWLSCFTSKRVSCICRQGTYKFNPLYPDFQAQLN